MKILSIDTSCDETSAAVTENNEVLSNIIWSQASLHAKWGGVYPTLARTAHREHIDWVVNKAMLNAKSKMANLDAIAVTVGPGLSIALEVGIAKAKELAKLYKKPLIAVNHVEAHLLSAFAKPKTSNFKSQTSNLKFPAYGLCISGKNTIFVYLKNFGKYEILAQTVDDALGEALDKGARMLGFGYPGGPILEKMAKFGNPKQNKFILPTPLVGQEKRKIFSYSGLKTSLFRLIETETKNNPNFPTKSEIYDLSWIYQDRAFRHIERVLDYILTTSKLPAKNLYLGGGVAANTEIRKRLRKLCKKFSLKLETPYTTKLYCDNAAMIGLVAYLKSKNKEFVKNIDKLDRNPRLKLGE